MRFFELIAAQCANHPVEVMTRNLPVSKAGYYTWKKRCTATISTEVAQVRLDRQAKVLAIHRESKGTYGSPRVTAELRARGELITEKTVALMMASIGIAGISPRTFKTRTTIVDPNASFPPDLVDRVFNQGRPDTVWTSDITYLTCGEGDLYFCAVKDEHTKRILGFKVADHMRADLVADCLIAAAAVRDQKVTGTIFHSDRGSQYTSTLVADTATQLGLSRSMGDTGICWDNAGAESLWSTFKHEYYYRHTFITKAELTAAVTDWVRFYNHQRRHSAIGYLSPINYEIVCTQANQAA
ncbi:IS3 family transposase [Nakamurella antarctica]|uniref:IS3 family transposase n=1 Tax=Nakamurella antarctica TaxID=1902245 RepID=UPI0013DE168C|nr:IS3 family transposase [Nakamurella antarctica]